MPATILSDKNTAVNEEDPAFVLGCARTNLMKQRVTRARICFAQLDSLVSVTLEPHFHPDHSVYPPVLFALPYFQLGIWISLCFRPGGPTTLLTTLQLRIQSHISVLLIWPDHKAVQPLTWSWGEAPHSQTPTLSQPLSRQGLSHKLSCFLNLGTLVPLKKGNHITTSYRSLQKITKYSYALSFGVISLLIALFL